MMTSLTNEVVRLSRLELGHVGYCSELIKPDGEAALLSRTRAVDDERSADVWRE